LIRRTRAIPSDASSFAPSITQLRFVNVTALFSTGPATAKHAADGEPESDEAEPMKVATTLSKLSKSPFRYCASCTSTPGVWRPVMRTESESTE
jgi:hypothetical protein